MLRTVENFKLRFTLQGASDNFNWPIGNLRFQSNKFLSSLTVSAAHVPGMSQTIRSSFNTFLISQGPGLRGQILFLFPLFKILSWLQDYQNQIVHRAGTTSPNWRERESLDPEDPQILIGSKLSSVIPVFRT